MRLSIAQRELFVEVGAGAGKATRNGVAIDAGVIEALMVGDELGFRRERFVVAGAASAATTVLSAAEGLPSRVAIEILPRGGRITFSIAGATYAVYLADRRFDLLVALLRPPGGLAAGELVPDDAVRAIVWPRDPGVSRQEVNSLISRCRRDLIEAGLAGPRLIERAPGGGATRFLLAPGARIEMAV